MNENLTSSLTIKSGYLEPGLLSMFRGECVGEQMCGFLDSKFMSSGFCSRTTSCLSEISFVIHVDFDALK